MAYRDFKLADYQRRLGLRLGTAELFPSDPAADPPPWLTDRLARVRPYDYVSEKSRSEAIVSPIVRAACEECGAEVAIFSGYTLDVDAEKGLNGECDFLLALSPPFPSLSNPIATLVEAKKNDVEEAIGQCAAKMVGAREYNRGYGDGARPVWGCATNAETWLFMRLTGDLLEFHPVRLLGQAREIYGGLRSILAQAAAWGTP